tara:strand:- start:306 stop:461 length:156 start_codon:yes stop_codon:yes gene_type:complete
MCSYELMLLISSGESTENFFVAPSRPKNTTLTIIIVIPSIYGKDIYSENLK